MIKAFPAQCWHFILAQVRRRGISPVSALRRSTPASSASGSNPKAFDLLLDALIAPVVDAGGGRGGVVGDVLGHLGLTPVSCVSIRG